MNVKALTSPPSAAPSKRCLVLWPLPQQPDLQHVMYFGFLLCIVTGCSSKTTSCAVETHAGNTSCSCRAHFVGEVTLTESFES